MARMSLPPGFRFHPTNEELVKYYLKRKLLGKKFKFEAISELDIYKYSPWDLRDKSCLRSKDLEWYFFCPIEKKYGSGARMNRATESGFWKSTGKDRTVLYKLQTVGMVKTLVFHKGHAPKGERTDWVMYEYRMQDNELADAGVVQDAYVLCKIFEKKGLGPKNGAQYGAPFNEEDYDDDGELCTESLPYVAQSLPALPSDNFVFVPGSTSSWPLSDPGPSKAFHSADEVPPPAPDNIDNGEICVESLPSVAQPLPALPSNNSVFVPGSTSSGPLSDPDPSKAIPSVDEVPPAAPDNIDDIDSMLDMFIEDSVLPPCENGNSMVESSVHANPNEGLDCLDATGIYNGLGDLDNNSAGPSGGRFNFSSHLTMEHGLNRMVVGNGTAFLELNDLNNPIRFAAEDTGSEHFLAENLLAPYDYNNWLLQSYFRTDSVGSAQLDSALNQSSLLPEGSDGLWDHLDASQMGNCNWGGADPGFASTSFNFEVAPCELLEGGTRHWVQGPNSGGSPDLGRIDNNSNDWNQHLHSTSNSNITRL